MLEDDVKRCLGCKGVEGFDDTVVPDSLVREERLLSRGKRECPHSNESRERGFPLCHSNRSVEVKVEDLLVEVPWRLLPCSEVPGGAVVRFMNDG